MENKEQIIVKLEVKGLKEFQSELAELQEAVDKFNKKTNLIVEVNIK